MDVIIILNPGGAPPSGVTLGSVVDRTGRRLGSRDNVNTIDRGIFEPDTVFGFSHPVTRIDTTTVLQIGAELMYVWEINSGTSEVTVQRGYRGTTPAVHNQGDLVTIDPLYPAVDIIASINDELNSLSGHGLYSYAAKEFTWTPSLVGYDLGDALLLEGVDLQYHSPTVFNEWPRIVNDHWRVEHNANTTSFPSGVALFVFDGGFPGRPMRFIYRRAFNPLVNMGDDVQQVAGLHSEASDVLSMGAAIRMADPLEIGRNEYRTQGDTRRPSEVPPGAILRAATDLERRYEMRLGEERSRLAKFYPMRRSGW